LVKRNKNVVPVGGSFRDKTNFVFELNGEMYRCCKAEIFEVIQDFIHSNIYKELSVTGKIVKTSIPEDSEIFITENNWRVLKHEKVKNISYKETWSFNMLKDAALLTLGIQEELLKHGYTLKDATPYNIQFCNHKPIFIDIGSIMRAEEEVFWSGYRQFCEMYLNPLLISSSLNLSLQNFYGVTTRGISSAVTWKMLKVRHKLRMKNIVNVYLQINKQKQNKSKITLDSELKEAGFTNNLRLNQVKRLKKIIFSLTEPKLNSNWDGYSHRDHYNNEEIREKSDLIAHAFSQKNYMQLVDWGCNDGMFSKKATELSEKVTCVALDNDPEVIDQLYLDCKIQNNRILPLVIDISNPPGAYGFNNLERKSFLSNIFPDLNIAYALVHHLFISENLPWSKIFELFSFKGDLIIEFPLPQDKKVLELLKLKKEPELYLDMYQCEIFEKELTNYFEIKKKVILISRNIYYCRNLND